MQTIKLKRGLDIPFEGAAALTLGSVRRPEVFHIVPDHFAGITPKLDVKVGDSVKAGSPLFHDKAFEEMQFTSPVSGKVVDIVRGDRRKVMSIDIQADATIAYEKFDASGDVKSLLLKSGLWALIKQRPYDCIAMPNKTPRAFFISSFDTAPAAPDYEFVLKGQLPTLQAGVSALAKLAPVYVGIRGGAKATEFRELKECTLFEVYGPHPAGNVGVQLNNLAPLAKGETVFTINIQDLAVIGRLFQKGIVDYTKKVALTGPLAYGRQYYNVLPGMPVAAIFKSNVHDEVACRYIAGNVLSGRQVCPESDIVSPYDNQFTVLEDGADRHEFMGWLMPRFANFNYPEYLIKAMIAGNIDRMEALGAYEVAPEDFALCEFVCTSKMPLQAIVRQALDNLKKEIE